VEGRRLYGGDSGGDLTNEQGKVLGIGTMNSLHNEHMLIKMKKRSKKYN
jgi:hypothetical protein